jgi:hypothetical protein
VVPFDLFSAAAQPGHEVAIDYPTDNTNGNGKLGNPCGTANATHGDATVTLDKAFFSATNQRWIIGWIVYSYTGSPTGGRLIITDTTNSETILDVDVASGAKDYLWFAPCLRCKPAATITVTLKDGGVGIVGKVNVHAWSLA